MADRLDELETRVDQAETNLDRAIAEDWPDDEVDKMEALVNTAWKRLRAEFPDHFEAKFRTAYPEGGDR